MLTVGLQKKSFQFIILVIPIYLSFIFLTCYIYTTGTLATEVTPVPLYLKQLRLVEVTGIKGQTKEKWNSLVEQLNAACEKLHYDTGFGNSGTVSLALCVRLSVCVRVSVSLCVSI